MSQRGKAILILFLGWVVVFLWIISGLRAQSQDPPPIFGGAVRQAGQSPAGIIWPQAPTYFLDSKSGLTVQSACGNGLSKRIQVTGLQDTLIGIDVRVSDGLLYAVGDAGRVYTIDSLGNATVIALMAPPFGGDVRSLVDFNPAAAGVPLRLIGANNQNYALTGLTLGATVPQTSTSYAQGDANAGKDPNISGGAYSNNFVGATFTILLALDYALNALVTPQLGAPNAAGLRSSNTGAGVFQTIGTLIGPNGKVFDLDDGADVDIYTRNGQNFLIGVNGRHVFTINLNQLGAQIQVRAIPLLPNGFRGIDVAVGPPVSCQ